MSLPRFRFLAVFLILVSFSLSSQPSRTQDLVKLISDNANWDFREFLLGKVRDNRVVMLADENHGFRLYNSTVTKFLDYWLANLEKNVPGTPRKLFLVLENDSVGIAMIKRYFRTDQPIDAIQSDILTGNQTTQATFEFLAELRDLWFRIQRLNSQRPKSALIHFDLIGPEKLIDPHQWSIKQREQFFLSERDEYSSARVKDLLADQPDAKVLIFYGSSHLNEGLQPKPAERPVGQGYYMAHYLREAYGNRVYTVHQISLPSSSWLDEAFRKINKPFAIDNSVWSNVAISEASNFPPGDAAIYHLEKPLPPTIITRIFSENLLDLILKDIDKYSDTKGEFNRLTLGAWFFYLSMISDKDYSQLSTTDSVAVTTAIAELKQWRKSSKIDIVSSLDNLSFWKKIIDRIHKMPQPQSTRWQRYLAGCLGFKVWFQAGAEPSARADALWNYVNRYKKEIVIHNLVPVLWVGTDSEKAKALAILRRESSQDFSTATQWSNWLEQQ